MGNILSAFGLIMDIFGAYLIYKNAAFSDVLESLTDAAKLIDKNIKTTNEYKLKSKIGFWLLIIGFVLQLTGTLFGLINIPHTP